MGTYKKISVEHKHDQQVLLICLNAPKGNVLDDIMMTEIIEVLETDALADPIKALVFHAEGPHFSFGASVEEHRKDMVAKMLGTFHRLFLALADVNKTNACCGTGSMFGRGT